MKDEHWKYILEVSCISGEGQNAIGFLQRSYANDLLVPFYEILNLDASRFGGSGRIPRLSGLKYEQAKIIHQPTREVLVISRNYPERGRYFFGGTGLYLEVFAPIETVENIMGISLAALDRDKIPDGFLRIGTYNAKGDIIPHDSVVDITEAMIEKRFEQSVGIFNLDIYHRRFNDYAGPDVSYSYDTLKDAVLALTDQDISAIGKPVGINSDPSVRLMQISKVGEPMIDVERHPPFLEAPVTGVPGIFYTVPDKFTLDEIQEKVDLFVLPHLEKGKYYFQVASYSSSKDTSPEPIAALDQLRAQLTNAGARMRPEQNGPYSVEFFYQVSKDGPPQITTSSFETAAEAVRALTSLPPEAFDPKNIKHGTQYLQRADLLHMPESTLVASMFKTTAAQNGLPGGVYLIIDKEQLTTSLASAMGPILSAHENGDKFHFLLAKTGDLANALRKHPVAGRTLDSGKNAGISL